MDHLTKARKKTHKKKGNRKLIKDKRAATAHKNISKNKTK